jgi:hypothetical protein
VTNTPSSTADRVCEDCPSDHYTSGSNQSVCVPTGACAPGTVQTAAGSDTSPPTCAACTAGQYCAGDTAAAVPCASGTWDDDQDPATRCVGWTNCLAGTYVSTPGTMTTDQECAACPSGSFSAGDNSSSCTEWTDCLAGTYVSVPPSATKDRTCLACDPGTYSSGINQSSCLTAGSCPAGTVQTSPGTPSSLPVCDACVAGQYCAGGESPAVYCEVGTWDDDHLPATECVSWTICAPGSHISAAGSTTTDQECAACDSGYYSLLEDVSECTVWQDCAAGTYVTNTPSAIQDRICEECPAGTFTSAANQSSCQPAGACLAGTVQTAPGTPTAPPTCEPCSIGQYCAGGTSPAITCPAGYWDHDANPATACNAWTTCSAGYRVSTPGSPTENRACTACAAGTFTATANQTTCADWQSCPEGTYVSNAPSTSADRICTGCAAGTFTDTSDQTSCIPWQNCAAGTHVSNTPSASEDRACEDCNDGTFTNTINQTSCSACSTNGCAYTCTHVGICVGCLSDGDCQSGLVCSIDKECVVPSCGGPAPYFADDFSSSSNGWTLDSSWEIGAATTWSGDDPKAGYKDPVTDHSAGTDNGIAGTVIGGSIPTDVMSAMSYLTSPVIDTSGGASPVILEYWRFLNLQKAPHEIAYLQVSADGSTWTTLWANGTPSDVTESEWMKYTYDVTSYRSASFQVRFGFQVTQNGAKTAGGWNIDDVRIANAPTCE